ncbi:MAG: hypothetical protein H0V92_05185 [Pseudonocardiales bacterium]|nr:hypothetical protein [Pseudonocardiales bacterium]
MPFCCSPSAVARPAEQPGQGSGPALVIAISGEPDNLNPIFGDIYGTIYGDK